MTDPKLSKKCIDAIRFLSADAVQKAKSGHPGTPMALSPLAYLLWTEQLRYNPENPLWAGRDRFILSCGHASMLLYSLLHLAGFEVSLDDLKDFRQWGSATPGHPEAGHTPGVEMTTGPLGQGIANAVGMAMAQRMLARRFNRPGFDLVNHRVVAICSDGDLMEGISQEAASIAGHHRLDNLVVFYDDNKITIEGSTDLAFSEDVAGRFAASGWEVLRIDDGNVDLDAMRKVVSKAFAPKSRPTLVIVKTTIAFGSPGKAGSSEAHGSPLGDDEIRKTKEACGWPVEPTFLVPEEVYAHFREVAARGKANEETWNARFDSYRSEHPALAAEFERVMAGALPDGWEKALPSFGPSDAMATRQAFGKVLNAVAQVVPELVGGSADLGPSNESTMKGEGSFLPDGPPGGRNIHFGIREHAMGAICNGMLRHGGVIPYCATFLVFADYMRPTVRLASLMNARVLFVYSHDSVGVGEDGPTHQPIEHLASLRIIPGVRVFRPADGNETASAFKAALLRHDGPSVLVTSRQKLPALDAGVAGPGAMKGGYVLIEASNGKPEVVLMGTGSEVHVTVEARKALEADGIPTRVVSLPCLELFLGQDAAYRDSVIPKSVGARVSVEAGITFGWDRLVGCRGEAVGIDRFGASAPGDRVMKELGITPENVVRAARESLARVKGGK